MTTTSKHPETLALHGGSYRKDPTTNAVAVPIIKLHHMSLIPPSMLQFICINW